MPARLPFPETSKPLPPREREGFLRGPRLDPAPPAPPGWWLKPQPPAVVPELDPARKQRKAFCFTCVFHFKRYEGAKTIKCPRCGTKWDRKSGKVLGWTIGGKFCPRIEATKVAREISKPNRLFKTLRKKAKNHGKARNRR